MGVVESILSQQLKFSHEWGGEKKVLLDDEKFAPDSVTLLDRGALRRLWEKSVELESEGLSASSSRRCQTRNFSERCSLLEPGPARIR